MNFEQTNQALGASNEEAHPSIRGEQTGKNDYQHLKENPTEAKNPAKHLGELKTRLFSEGRQEQYVASDSKEGRAIQELLTEPRGFMKAALEDDKWPLALNAFETAYGFEMVSKNEGKQIKLQHRPDMFWLDPDTMKGADGLELQFMKRDLESIIKDAETKLGSESKYNRDLQEAKIRLAKINEAIEKKYKIER